MRRGSGPNGLPTPSRPIWWRRAPWPRRSVCRRRWHCSCPKPGWPPADHSARCKAPHPVGPDWPRSSETSIQRPPGHRPAWPATCHSPALGMADPAIAIVHDPARGIQIELAEGGPHGVERLLALLGRHRLALREQPTASAMAAEAIRRRRRSNCISLDSGKIRHWGPHRRISTRAPSWLECG
jgi:hypothetical protein